MGFNLPEYAQYAVVLIFVLGLIFLLSLVLRRFTGIGGGGQAPFSRRLRRLRVSEGASLGGRHRLILIRRDNVEHLLLIGGASDLVIESGITVPHPKPASPPAPYPAAEETDHIEPSFTAGSSEPASSRDDELAKSKALLDRLSKSKDGT